MGEISMKINSAFVFILIITIPLDIYTFVHLYSTVTSVIGWSKLGLILWPSHLLLRYLHSLSWDGCNLFYLECLKMAPRLSATMCIYRIDWCHYLYRKIELWYALCNPPSRFLCLKFMHFSSLCLHPLTQNAWQFYLHQLAIWCLCLYHRCSHPLN